jgi:zinc finger protein
MLSFPYLSLQLLSLEQEWTLILDDELANSFISPVTDDIKDDHQLTCKLLNVP